MKKLILTIALFLSLTAQAKQPAHSVYVIPFYLYNAASSFNLDVGLMYSICLVESQCRPGVVNHDDGNKAHKAAGKIIKAYGMFQIQEPTAIFFGFKPETIVITKKKINGKVVEVKKIIDNRKELLNPRVNAWYAAKLLRHLYDRYGDTVKVLSAYNAGHYTKHNKAYVNKVLTNYARYKIDRKQ